MQFIRYSSFRFLFSFFFVCYRQFSDAIQVTRNYNIELEKCLRCLVTCMKVVGFCERTMWKSILWEDKVVSPPQTRHTRTHYRKNNLERWNKRWIQSQNIQQLRTDLATQHSHLLVSVSELSTTGGAVAAALVIH